MSCGDALEVLKAGILSKNELMIMLTYLVETLKNNGNAPDPKQFYEQLTESIMTSGSGATKAPRKAATFEDAEENGKRILRRRAARG